MRPGRVVAAGLLLASAALGAPGVHAERTDREKPMNVEADRLSLDDIKKESVFEGNVQLTQGTLMLRADRVVVRQDAQGFNYAFATGDPAYIRQKREGMDEYIEGFAQRLEYDGKQDKVEMFTGARVKKGIDEVRGDYISYNAATEFYQVIGGGAAAATTANPQGRVRAVIQPKKQLEKPARPDKSASPPAAAEGAALAAPPRNPPQQ